jgi:hypothetical protein
VEDNKKKPEVYRELLVAQVQRQAQVEKIQAYMGASPKRYDWVPEHMYNLQDTYYFFETQ